MKMKKIGCVMTAAVMGMQLSAYMPVTAVTAPSVSGKGVCSLSEFADGIRAVTERDADRQFYDTVTYGTGSDVLTADGNAETGYGDLTVRNGELMICAAAPEQNVQSAGTIRRFADAASEFGYETEQDGDTLTITNEFQTARLIVKAAGEIDAHGAQSVTSGYRDLHILQYATTAQAYAAYQAYQDDPAVQYVQPSHIVSLDPVEPDTDAAVSGLDSQSYMTWGADLIGTEAFYQKYLADKNLPEVRIAVIDTGINDAPELFKGRILPGGVNYSSSGDDSVSDDLYHGTHVAGTICELTPDNVKILPIKSFDKSGHASDEQIYAGIMYALENNADVLNMSFGGLGVNPLEVEAMMIAEKSGMICCAAAGNNADDARFYYPSSIKSCITVAAVSNAMKRADFSNFGEMIDVSAPGVGIVSYGIEGADQKISKDGTSMATPHVTACCALLRSYDKEMSADRAERLLTLNATDLGEPGFDKDTGWGLVCMKDFRWSEGICKAPVFSEDPGNYGTAQTVELTAEDDSMQIYYTTDGTVPSAENGTLYTEPLEIAASARILAVAVKKGYQNSVPAEAIYTIGGKDIAGAWEYADGFVTKYRGVRKEVRVPETLEDGMQIVGIGPEAFAGNRSVEKVVLPETVTEIGERAFAGCTSLTEISAGNVESIGAGAFADDSLLEKAEFGTHLTEIGKGAFRLCTTLPEISLDTVRQIPDECFDGCYKLQKLSVQAAESFGDRACLNCVTLETILTDWRQVTAIGARAFSACNSLTADVYAEKLETLGDHAFEDACSVVRIVLPEGIRVIPEGAFSGCSGLRLLELRGAEVFRNEAAAIGSSREDFRAILPYDRITELGMNALQGMRLGNGFDTVTFSALEQLSIRSFAGVTVGVLDLPNVKTVPHSAFQSANVYCLRLDAAETLETGALLGVRSVQLTDSVKEIDAGAIPDETWVVTAKDTVLPDTGAALQLCQEPLVMRLNQRSMTVHLHEHDAFRITALGVGLKYQWYHVDGDSAEPVPQADSAEFAPPTDTAGTEIYRCILTDAAGRMERVEVEAVVTEEAKNTDLSGSGYDDQIDVSGTYRYLIPVPQTGSYEIEAAGAAAVSGVLTDTAGNVLGSFPAEAADAQMFRVMLEEGQNCLLTVNTLWDGPVLIQVRKDPAERKSLAGCKVQVLPALFGLYGNNWHPDLIVTAPDGHTLTESVDYTVLVSKQNGHMQLVIVGIGGYVGSCTAEADVIDRIPADTPVPVTLNGKKDSSTFLFIPSKTETYYYYAGTDSHYQREWETKQTTGSYGGRQMYTGISARCVVSSQPDGKGTVFAESSYSTFNDNQFCGSVKLNAGQMYYLTCTIREERTVKFTLVVSDQLRDIRKADLEGDLFAVYREGECYEPEIRLNYGGETLKQRRDYFVLNARNDAPGTATVTLVGTGLFIGKISRDYEIIAPYKKAPETLTPLGETTLLNCEDTHLATLWFRADQAKEGSGEARYRVLNEQVSGGTLIYRVYRLDEQLKAMSLVRAMPDDKNDYLLRNGIYCVAVSRTYEERGGKTNLTVVTPYSLQDAELTTGETAYTGSEVQAPVTLTMPDGTVLQQGRDFVVAYAEDYANVMFGEVPFTLRSTKYSYGSGAGSYKIVVKLPETAEQLTEGEYAAPLTLTDRLAWYRLTPEQDTDYLLASDDVTDIVLRVFSDEAEMLEETAGTGTKALTFSVPAGETRYIMVKYNGLNREGTLHFRLETDQKALASCAVEAKPVYWTGDHVTPDITLTDGDYELVEGEDYVQRYIINDVDVGTASVNYIGRGRYVGMLDVDFPVVFNRDDFQEQMDDMMLTPLMLDYEYTIRNTEEQRYRLFSYYSPLDAQIRMSVYNARCKLAIQMYNTVGDYLKTLDVSRAGDLDFEYYGGTPFLYLFSASDISSSNQYWNMQLTDLTNTDLEIFEDPDTGMFYRIFPDGRTAELYRVDPTRSELIYHDLPDSSRDIRVESVQPGIFPVIPKSTVIYGSSPVHLIRYLDYYHLLFLPLPYSVRYSDIQGDLNGDGYLSPSDAVLFSAILNENAMIDKEWINLNTEIADLNGDGYTDMLDLMQLMNLVYKDSYFTDMPVPLY